MAPRLLLLTFGTGVLHLIEINHQPDATIFQFIILTFVYSSTCTGRFPAHHQELSDCSGSLWFYLRIVVKDVLCSLKKKMKFFDIFSKNTQISNSNKSPTRCNNFSVYYPYVYLQLNMFRAFSRPSLGAQ
jgi:hypothetical protein